MKTKYIFLCCLLFTFNAVTAQKVITGAEQMDHLLPILKGKRVALVVNQTSRVGETHLLIFIWYDRYGVIGVLMYLFAPKLSVRCPRRGDSGIGHNGTAHRSVR